MKQFFLVKRIRTFVFITLLLSACINARAYDVIVAKDGSGNYTTVQAALNAAPTGRTTPYTIFIKNGRYKEKDTVASNKPFIQLIGESVGNVIITWDDYSGKAIPGGGVYGTGNSATVTVSAADFAAINITFENTTGESPQALAIGVTGDRATFKNCRFLGGQDTVFAGGNGARQYFRNCYIDGTVDFIFGDARAVFDTCIIYPKTRSVAGQSFMTAPNTKQTEAYGYVFRDCKVPANRGTTVYFLGRPWQNDAATADAAKSYNKTFYLNTTMTSSVQAAGWTTWDAGTDVTKITYAEYKSKNFNGTLVDVSQRVPWSSQLSDVQAATYYNNSNLFGTWDPCAVYAGVCTNSQPDIVVSNFKGVKGTSTSSFTWNISWPITQVQYEVLRSNDKVTFTPVNSQVAPNDTAVNFNYTESVPPPGVTYYYLIRASKSGYSTHISDTVAISSTPTINVTGSMGSFIQGVGTPSTSQSYIVSASSLTNTLIITAPSKYELSTNGGTTWNISSNPVVLTPDGNGNIANTTISVRLNATSAGTYSGNILHSSTGAADVNLAVTGTVQSSPLSVSNILQWWPMTVSNADSAAVRSSGLIATTPTLNKLYLSNGTTVPTAPAYSPLHGQAFGATSNGDGTWTTALGGPGANLNRTFFEQYTITASGTYSVRLDSLILNNSFYNSNSGTKLAVVYSLSGFVSDSADATGGVGPAGQLAAGANGAFATPVLLNNETAGNLSNYRFALAGGTGLTLASNQTLTVRLYFSCGSGSAGRYAKVKDIQVKGLATPNPILGDYRSHQSGDWTDLTAWERWDGSTWVTPAPAYPVYNNSNIITILNGHTLTVSASLVNGSGYIHLTKINTGGQIIVNSAAALKIASDGVPSTATIDMQVDGAMTVFGALQTNGNVSFLINGSFVNSSTGSTNMSNAGDSVNVGPQGIYQHNVNSNTTPAAMIWQPGSTFLITGLTNSQTGIFKNNIKYSNIVWNNAGESSFYAIRTTLDSIDVTGSFTVQNTGSTYISFANSNARTVFPGGFYQTGGTVNFRESGTTVDTLSVGGDFSVTGGTFNSNSAAGTSLLVRLTGVNKSLIYSQAGGTNTNWDVSGIYTLGANLQIPTATFGMNVGGTLNTSTYTIGGAGNFTLAAGGILSSGSVTGLDGNIIVTGTKSFSTLGNYVFNGAAGQVTGTTFPASVNALTINNAANLSLSGSIDVATSLTLANGKLILGNNNISASSVLNSSSSKYIVTDGTGALKIKNIGAGSNLFPVGPGIGNYNPVTLNNAGSADNFSVRVKNTFDNAAPDPTKVVNDQWTITEETPGGSNVTVGLSWITADQASGFDPAVSSSIMRFNGTAWANTPAPITGAGTLASPYTATASGFTGFSPFGVINNSGPLPVTLLSFNAGFDNQKVKATWSSSNEINVKRYVVQRSTDANNFVDIGLSDPRNIALQSDYSFIDDNPLKGVSYYRLKILNVDGSYTYSNIVSVNSKLTYLLSINPNPVVDNITVSYPKANAGATISILTTDGRLISSYAVLQGSVSKTINAGSLTKGTYFLIYQNNADKLVTKLIKQ